jgi:hypothetical protein
MIKNQNKYLTFAFGALSGLATVPLDSEFLDARCLHFLLPNSPEATLFSDGELGHCNSLPSIIANWRFVLAEKEAVISIDLYSHTQLVSPPTLPLKKYFDVTSLFF